MHHHCDIVGSQLFPAGWVGVGNLTKAQRRTLGGKARRTDCAIDAAVVIVVVFFIWEEEGGGGDK